jgi:hypothetical protein
MKTLHFACCLLLLCLGLGAAAQVPLLNSHPSASATVYLDFDGHYLTGTAWNMSGPIQCQPSGLTPAQMEEVFHRVAEDYRPFNLNVTTDSVRYQQAPAEQRMRLIATVSWEWYGSAGGVSYMNSFTWGDNTPCFVFTSLLNFKPKNIAEAGSHEVGHTMGLRHQSAYDGNCVKTAEYHAGVGGGEIAWAPIMGVGYYRNLTLWNNGANPYGCNSIQNDLEVLTTYNGFTYRTDDYSANLNGSATSLPVMNNEFRIGGVIERSTDHDVFRFSMPTTTLFRLQGLPFGVASGNVGANLDIQIELYAGQTLVATFNPTDKLCVTIDTTLSSGTYYLRVKGRGNIYAPDYASLGSYTLQGRIGSSGVLPLRRLELTGAQAGEQHQLSWLIDADEAVVRQTLEVSTDGIRFTPALQPATTSRRERYTPSSGNNAYYRLHVVFDNGKQYYSNVVGLRCVNRSFPVLVGVQSSQVRVSSPGRFDYQFTDATGRCLQKGRLVPGMNTMPLPAAGNGYFLVQFMSGSERQTERFIRP